MKSVIDHRLLGPGDGRADFGPKLQEELKVKFGAMINATSKEMNVVYRRKDGHYGLIEASAAKVA